MYVDVKVPSIVPLITTNKQMIDLTEFFANHPVQFVDVAFHPQTKNTAVVLSNDMDGAAYIINRDGVIVKQDECGFDSWTMIPSAKEYLDVFVRYCDEDFQVHLFNKHYEQLKTRNN